MFANVDDPIGDVSGTSGKLAEGRIKVRETVAGVSRALERRRARLFRSSFCSAMRWLRKSVARVSLRETGAEFVFRIRLTRSAVVRGIPRSC